ncbi:MAG: hypothetical protein H7Z15_12825 [Rhizobacter sp.]|nr:hypothetical protein [Rhizobacter sp.]
MNIVGSVTFVLLSTLALSPATAALTPSDFSGLATITFETGTTGLPSVEGAYFLDDSPHDLPQPSHWFRGDATFGHMYRADQNQFFGQQMLANVAGPPGYSDFGIRFLNPVEAVGAWLFTFPRTETPGAVEFIARNSVGQVLDSHQFVLPTAPDAFTPPMFYGFASQTGADISQVEWRIVGDPFHAGFFGVDNVSYGTIAVVPIPSAAVLLGMGLTGLLGSGRVRRRSIDSLRTSGTPNEWKGLPRPELAA